MKNKKRSVSKKIGFILIVCTILLSQQKAWAQPKLSTKASEKGLEIDYKGKVRFTGGKPMLENRSGTLKAVKSKSGTYTYSFDQALAIQSNLTDGGSNIRGISLSVRGSKKRNGKEFAGFFFDEIPGFSTGVEIWRYKPWNSWTKPIRVTSPADLHDWDVQFFYWKYEDGLYGAAIPLSGNGYRTTLGTEKGRFGCKAYTYNEDAGSSNIPMLAIGFGEDPYQLFEDLYKAGLKMMGKADKIRENKAFPEPLEYIGC